MNATSAVPLTRAIFAGFAQLRFGGMEREYSIHLPPTYDGTQALPLVLNFHGYKSNMNEQAIFSAMNAKADSAGFAVAYPNGLQNPGTSDQSWNAGNRC